MLEKITDYYYENYSQIDDENVEKYLKKAIRIVKQLLHNRLTEDEYLKNCSDFEIETINNCVCDIAEFYYLNEDKLNYLFKNYSLGDLNISVELNTLAANDYLGIPLPNLASSELSSLRHFSRSSVWR